MISAETFYPTRAEQMLEPHVRQGDVAVNRTARLEGQPPAMYAAALLTDHRDGDRETADEFVNTEGERLQAVTVYAQEERWVVECPFCPNAQMAAETDHRFFCNDCANASAGGQYVKTEWPTE